MNMNDLFNMLTNFKIKIRTDKLTPVDISNMTLIIAHGSRIMSEIDKIEIVDGRVKIHVH